MTQYQVPVVWCIFVTTMPGTPQPRLLTETEVGKSGKFKIPIKLPKEGVFMVTVTAEMEAFIHQRVDLLVNHRPAKAIVWRYPA